MPRFSGLTDELQALKSDLSRLLDARGEDIFEASKHRAEALADQIQAALGDLGDTLSREEDRIGDIISDRISNSPVATLASAFALGVMVGVMLRRH